MENDVNGVWRQVDGEMVYIVVGSFWAEPKTRDRRGISKKVEPRLSLSPVKRKHERQQGV